MTTIATDGKTVAADGLVQSNGFILKTDDVKIFRIGKEIIGCAGDSGHCSAYVRWVESGRDEDDKPDFDSPFNAMHVQRGKCFLVCKDFELTEVDFPFSIGHGSEFATGAILAGASPKKAVELACKATTYSGGKITVLQVK